MQKQSPADVPPWSNGAKGGRPLTAILLLASLVALLILSLAIRNEPLRFVLFFVQGCLTLALWKVFAELPWWGWLLFAAVIAAALLAWRYAVRRRRPE